MLATEPSTATRSAPLPISQEPFTLELLREFRAHLQDGKVFMENLHGGELHFDMWYDAKDRLYYSRYQFRGHPFVQVHTPFLLIMLREIKVSSPVLFGTMRARLCA